MKESEKKEVLAIAQEFYDEMESFWESDYQTDSTIPFEAIYPDHYRNLERLKFILRFAK
jgi:hypothetical protein